MVIKLELTPAGLRLLLDGAATVHDLRLIPRKGQPYELQARIPQTTRESYGIPLLGEEES